MGILGKFKNIFYDTIEEEDGVEAKPTEEIKKPKIEEFKIEELKEEKKVPIIEKEPTVQKTDTTFSERELFKSEKTFNFTEFDDEEEIKPRVNVIELERQNRNNIKSNSNINSNIDYTSKPQPTKIFKPSPVISPIYGILDKDYKKEEIKEKSNQTTNNSSSSASYDTVRKKAYGTLEDTFEDTLIKVTTTDITAVVNDINNDVEKLEKTAKLEELINEIEKNAELTVGEIEDKAKDDSFNDDTEEIKINNSLNNSGDDEDYNEKTMTNDTLEHDLFNLIDSMYDDKED